MRTVVTCPHCIRSYHVASELNGKLARCGECGCHFGINIVELALPGEAVTLDGPFEVHYSYLFEAASVMALKAETMFCLAGEPFTPETLVKFVKSLPRTMDALGENDFRDGYADKVMREAHRRSTYADHPRLTGLLDYFTGHVPSRGIGAQKQLIAAFAGVLSVEFDRPTGTEIALYRKPGPLERWAARRGW